MKKEGKEKLVLFDRLRLHTQEEGLTIWKGEKGTYAFRNIKPQDSLKPNYPIRRVFLNRKYLTGLFRGKEGYTGDILEEKGKRKLLFKPLSKQDLHIYERVFS